MQRVTMLVVSIVVLIIVGCSGKNDSATNITQPDKCVENSYLQCNCDAGTGIQKCVNGSFNDCICDVVNTDSGTIDSNVTDVNITDANTSDVNVSDVFIDTNVSDSNVIDSGNDSGESCSPGTVKCDNKLRMSCNINNVWTVDQTCDFMCTLSGNKTECIGVCIPGTKRCNNNNIEFCSSEGEWQINETCVLSCDSSGVNPVCIGKSCCSSDNGMDCNCEKKITCSIYSKNEPACSKLFDVSKECCIVIPGATKADNVCNCLTSTEEYCQERLAILKNGGPDSCKLGHCVRVSDCNPTTY